MNQPPHHDRRGNSDPGPMESLQIAQAISNAHLKFLLAEKKDVSQQILDLEGTYRHRKLALKDLGFGPQRHVAIMLVPRADRAEDASVTRLALDVPTIPVREAGKTLIDMYRTNLVKNAPRYFDERNKVDLTDTDYVPTRDIFGEAFNSDGDSIKFLLAPTGLHAYEFIEDIIPAEPQLVAAGQQYVVGEGLGTWEAQMKLMSEWFADAQSLSELIDSYEPIQFDGTNGTNGSTGTNVA